MNILRKSVLATAVVVAVMACESQNVGLSGSDSLNQLQLDVAQTSGQLASGTSFSVTGSSTDSTATDDNGHGHGKHGGKGRGKHPGILDGLDLLAPTDELLAIVDAESASDLRGMRISRNGGATITNYNAAGEEVTLTLSSSGPQGCSFSGHQFKEYDSLLSTIVKTVIDFGSGVTYTKDTVEITRAGKITIERTTSGTTKTEVTTFENYVVNGIGIQGVKTRVSTYDETTGTGTSTTSVSGGKFILADGTEATWTSTKTRTSVITFDDDGRPESGTITTEVDTEVATATTVIYSHKSTTPLVENVGCERRRRGPVSGVLETIYRENTLSVNFGDGTCENKTITITLNGEVTTKTID